MQKEVLGDTAAQTVLTVREVAGILGLNPATVYRAIERREIPSISVGRRILVPVALLHRFLAGRHRSPCSLR